MQFNELDLNIDITSGTLVRDYLSSVGAFLPPFRRGDSKLVKVRALAPTRLPDAPWREIGLSGKTVRVGIGVPGEDFDSGTFTIQFNGNTTSPILYNADASVVETSLNALASITSVGGVDVIGARGGPWTVTFRTVGDRGSLVVDGTDLFPVGSGKVTVITQGSSLLREIVQIEMSIDMLAFAQLGDDLPPAAAVVTTVISGSVSNNEIQLIDLSDPEPYGGVYTLTFNAQTTGAISHDASAADIQLAIEALPSVGVGQVLVTGVFPVYEVEFTGTLGLTNVSTITASVAGLRVPSGKMGLLNLNTYQLGMYLKGNRIGVAYLEIEISDGTDIATLVQVPVDISEDLLGDEVGTPLALPSPDSWLSLKNTPISVANNNAKKALTGLYIGTYCMILGEARRIERYMGDIYGNSESNNNNWLIIGFNTVDLWLQNNEATTATFQHPDGMVSIPAGTTVRVGWIKENWIYIVTGLPSTVVAYISQVNLINADPNIGPSTILKPFVQSFPGTFILAPIFPPRAQVRLRLD